MFWSFVKKYERYIIIGAIVILLFVVIIVSIKKERYASQEVHAYAGNVAGPFTDWNKYYGIENYQNYKRNYHDGNAHCGSCGSVKLPPAFDGNNLGNQNYYDTNVDPLFLRPYGCPTDSCPYGCVQDAGGNNCPY